MELLAQSHLYSREELEQEGEKGEEKPGTEDVPGK